MGSDQSHHQGQRDTSAPCSPPPMSPTLADFMLMAGGGSGSRDGAISPPQDSVCSDSEVPYVSYTVDRPIGGDSPQKRGFSSHTPDARGPRTMSMASAVVAGFRGSGASFSGRNTFSAASSSGIRFRSTSMDSSSAFGRAGSKNVEGSRFRRPFALGSNKAGNTAAAAGKPEGKSTLVVVKRGVTVADEDCALMAEDPELARLRQIPSFLPIMKTSLLQQQQQRHRGQSGSPPPGSPGRDHQEVVGRLDPSGLVALCQRYQNHLKFSAGVVCTEQAQICRRIRDVDECSSRVTAILSERQKVSSRHADELLRRGAIEMSRSLTRCHTLLNELMEQMELLNNMLPIEDRLEPFVWTTG